MNPRETFESAAGVQWNANGDGRPVDGECVYGENGAWYCGIWLISYRGKSEYAYSGGLKGGMLESFDDLQSFWDIKKIVVREVLRGGKDF